jgi:hypothetical protein
MAQRTCYRIYLYIFLIKAVYFTQERQTFTLEVSGEAEVNLKKFLDSACWFEAT